MSTAVPSSQYKGLEKFFVQEGMAYRIVPIKTGRPEQGDFGMIDPEVMYDNMMNKFGWGNAADPDVYLDENNRRMLSNFRRIFGNLGNAMLVAGDTVRAVEAARKGLEIVPASKMPNDYFSMSLAEVLLRAGKKEEAEKVIDDILDYSREYLEYAVSLKPERRFGMDYATGINMQSYLDLYNMSVKLELDSLTKKIEPEVSNFYSLLYSNK